MKAKNIRKSYIKPILLGAAILAVLVLHFAVSQFIALKGEKDLSVSELIEKQPVLIEPKTERKAAETIGETSVVSPIVERREQKIEPARAVERETVNRKKTTRESRTERLRRTEKILTGI